MKLETLFEEGSLNDLKHELVPKTRAIAAKLNLVLKTGSGATRVGKDGVWFCFGIDNGKDHDPTADLPDDIRMRAFVKGIVKMLGEYADQGRQIRVGKGLSPVNTPVPKADLQRAVEEGIQNDYVGGIRTGNRMPCLAIYVGSSADTKDERYFGISVSVRIQLDKPIRQYGRLEYVKTDSVEFGTTVDAADKKTIMELKALLEAFMAPTYHARNELVNMQSADGLKRLHDLLKIVDYDLDKLRPRSRQGENFTPYANIYLRGPTKSFGKKVVLIDTEKFKTVLSGLVKDMG